MCARNVESREGNCPQIIPKQTSIFLFLSESSIFRHFCLLYPTIVPFSETFPEYTFFQTGIGLLLLALLWSRTHEIPVGARCTVHLGGQLQNNRAGRGTNMKCYHKCQNVFSNYFAPWICRLPSNCGAVKIQCASPTRWRRRLRWRRRRGRRPRRAWRSEYVLRGRLASSKAPVQDVQGIVNLP